MSEITERVLAQLDRWRHLPGYQLERRADIFFAMWLPHVLSEFTGHAVDARLVPELPIKKALFDGAARGDESVNVDYFVLGAGRERAWLVEIKTDMNSRRERQDKAMAAAVALGWHEVARGICDIMTKYSPDDPGRDRKYRHLSKLLGEIGLLEVPEDLDTFVFAERRQGLSQRLRAIRPSAVTPALEVVYVQPTASGDDSVITFEFFAAQLERLDDPAALCFARYLRRWVAPAGSKPTGQGAGDAW